MHDCWNCGRPCYCHGDWDDCVVETAEYSYENCEGCGCEEDDECRPDDYCPACQGLGEGPCVCSPISEAGTEGRE